MKVTIFNPLLPNGNSVSSEECCWGDAIRPALHSPTAGLASELLRRGHEVSQAWTFWDLPEGGAIDAVVVPVTTGFVTYQLEVARKVREMHPNAVLLAMTTPQGLADKLSEMSHPFDHVLGESPVPGALKALTNEECGYFPQIDPRVVPDREFVPWLLVGGGSCVWNCTYCSWGHGKGVKWRDPENAVASLEAMYSSPGCMRLSAYVICPEVDANRAWLEKFGELKRASPAISDLGLTTDIRADCATERIVELCKAAGVVEVIAGLESPDPEILRSVDRRMDLDRWVAGHARLKAAGIRTAVPVLFNLSDDEDPDAYAAFCKANGIEANPGICKIYPGTTLDAKTPPEGREPIREWPEPADPLETRKGLAAAQRRLARFKALMADKSTGVNKNP